MSLKWRGAVSIKDQIRGILLREIAEGLIGSGSRLPTERELSQRFEVSLSPVRAALADLEKAGKIERVQGKGTFVRDKMIAIKLGVLPSFTSSLRSQGLAFTVRVLAFGLASPPSDIGRALGLGRSAQAFHLRRLVNIEGIPAACLDAWFSAPPLDGPDLQGALQRGHSLYQLALERSGIVFRSVAGSIIIESATDEMAGLLDLSFATPLAKAVMISTDTQHSIAEYSAIFCDAKRFVFEVQGQGGDAPVDLKPVRARNSRRR